MSKNRYLLLATPLIISLAILFVYCDKNAWRYAPIAIHQIKAEVGEGVFKPEEFTLPNGLKVITATNRRAPMVKVMLWYKVGSVDEPHGRSGIAHLFEHLMFNGTKTVGPGEFMRRITDVGGENNAFTSWDYTAYHELIAKEHLDMVLGLEADRMVNLNLTDPAIAKEIKVVLEERRKRTENDPESRLGDAMFAALFPGHPYSIPVIGWESEISASSFDDIRAFYKKWYGPDNAILVISGDVDAAEILPLVRKHFGGLRPVNPPKPIDANRQKADVSSRVTLRDPQVGQPSLQVLYAAPSFNTAADKREAHALEVLAEIMGGGATSRLYKSLVVDKKLCVGAAASYDLDSRFDSLLSFSIVPASTEEAYLQKAEAALHVELAKAAERGFTDAEVAEAKKRLQRSAIFARDSVETPASIIGSAEATGTGAAAVENWPEMIAAVTTKDVNLAAQKVLPQPDNVTGILLPPTKSRSIEND